MAWPCPEFGLDHQSNGKDRTVELADVRTCLLICLAAPDYSLFPFYRRKGGAERLSNSVESFRREEAEPGISPRPGLLS